MNKYRIPSPASYDTTRRFSSEDEYMDAKDAAAWEEFCSQYGVDRTYRIDEVACIEVMGPHFAKYIIDTWEQFREGFEL